MIDSMSIAIGALHAHQQRLDATSHNLANVHTPGFKKSRVSFEDLMYRPMVPSTIAAQAAEQGLPHAGFVGLGTVAARVERQFSQGDLRQTERPLDIAIVGQGFFEVELEDGSRAYTRLGSLRLDGEGELTTAEGRRLTVSIRIPPDATAIEITRRGEVLVQVPGETAAFEAGRLELVNFINAAALQPVGEGLFKATDAAGVPMVGEPGEAGLGLLRQGFVEASNVDFMEELVELVAAQRAYQLNARVLQASDEILAEINGLRR